VGTLWTGSAQELAGPPATTVIQKMGWAMRMVVEAAGWRGRSVNRSIARSGFRQRGTMEPVGRDHPRSAQANA